MRIVIIGGTGLIGSKLVAKLGARGHEAVAAAPSTGVNALTGEGLGAALKGADVVIDVSNSPSFEDAEVLEFFEKSTGNLLAAEKEAGVAHHVALSVVGTDRRPDIGYFRAKIAQQDLIKESGVPYSIVHATQFYEFGKRIADGATEDGEVHIAPVAFQPIAADDVADNVAKTAIATPLNGSLEIAGPTRYRMDDFFREALHAWHDPRTVVTDPHAHYFGAELDNLTLVPTTDATLGEIPYNTWLPTNT
ncbi:SDR family oxidoreductase [Actinocorallia sp. A-T 12471]|uniref:SDR family oxidoreductase n=1 Tax=Actinocorallia sp. A-T 12471 TaxID=3089813 RepID=UPI0029D0B245|nr:SDR family oxidoreductase [Actinocorallia sp. A-T 12471]MDX6744197.1 SDR family oxidoreductase [Actinocorallia sp. A-T 12471]